MRVIRKIIFLALLLIAALFVQNASATLTQLSYLPDSSYAEAVGNWQGRSFYEKDGLYVMVEFAVYDTSNLQPDSEEQALVEQLEPLNMTGQYIYAYQIFNHPDANEEGDIGYFEIFGLETNINEASIGEDGVNWQDDQEDGVSPSDGYFDSERSRVVWEFNWGALIGGKHSYVLVIASDYDPVKGDYEAKGFEAGGDAPVMPEPATIVLLGLGSVVFLKRQRKLV